MGQEIIPFYNPTGKLILKSNDCYLYDSEGKKYIDFESGVWCVNLGHGNPHIIKRISRQIRESIHHGYHFRNELAEKLSVKLQQLIGYKNGASVFLSSGSEAVNLSITLARHITGREKILKIDNSYLSAFGHGQLSDENETLVNVPYNDLDAIDEIDFQNIAAFVLETGGASVQMVRFPDEAFIEKLIHACHKHNCLIIGEEVTTGMGRLGKWFGFQHYSIEPDMVVTGKALGNGYPVSGLTINSTLNEKFMNQPFRYAQSHQNDPLGCAVALETIKQIELNNLVSQSETTGQYVENKLSQVRNNHPDRVKEIRARGLMIAMEFDESVDGARVHQKLFENGIVAGFKMNTLRFLPPLTIKNADIDKLAGKLDEILRYD